jgi:hypothetical protein
MQKTVENFLTGYPGNGDNIFMNSASYQLNNPLNFIMAFFSASLIILVSIVGILYPVAQVYSLFKPKK